MNKISIVLTMIVFGVISWFDSGEARATFCPGWGCGGNAATVGDGIVFDELDTKGRWLPNGLRIQHAALNNKAVRLQVQGHLLSAIDVGPPGATHTGQGLVGLTFVIQHIDGRAYEVRIYRVHEKCEKRDDPSDPCLTFWTAPTDEVPYFDFRVKKIHKRRSPPPGPVTECGDDRPIEQDFKEQLCKGGPLEPGLWQAGSDHAAITFEGDHYDAERKTVSKVRPGDGRFNLACGGAAIAKMHLLRHSEAGSIKNGASPLITTIDERAAMLKMLTADYCGDGMAWTADGTPLSYADARGRYVSPPPPTFSTLTTFSKLRVSTNVEGVWSAKGALCLNQPRRVPVTPAPASCTSPGVQRPEVAMHCQSPEHGVPPRQIPKCDPTIKGYVVSVNVSTPGPYCDPP